MSQTEQYEVICKRCSYNDILDHEPLEDHECSLCHYRKISDEEKENKRFSMDKTTQKKIPPRTWLCGNHHKGFKWGTACPQCQEEYDKKHQKSFTITKQPFPNLIQGRIQGEIEQDKDQQKFVSDSFKTQLALQKAQLETPHLIKKQMERQAKRDELILKALERLNKNLEDKNEVQ